MIKEAGQVPWPSGRLSGWSWWQVDLVQWYRRSFLATKNRDTVIGIQWLRLTHSYQGLGSGYWRWQTGTLKGRADRSVMTLKKGLGLGTRTWIESSSQRPFSRPCPCSRRPLYFLRRTQVNVTAFSGTWPWGNSPVVDSMQKEDPRLIGSN